MKKVLEYLYFDQLCPEHFHERLVKPAVFFLYSNMTLNFWLGWIWYRLMPENMKCQASPLIMHHPNRKKLNDFACRWKGKKLCKCVLKKGTGDMTTLFRLSDFPPILPPAIRSIKSLRPLQPHFCSNIKHIDEWVKDANVLTKSRGGELWSFLMTRHFSES